MQEKNRPPQQLLRRPILCLQQEVSSISRPALRATFRGTYP